jgi:hypothetical protein
MEYNKAAEILTNYGQYLEYDDDWGVIRIDGKLREALCLGIKVLESKDNKFLEVAIRDLEMIKDCRTCGNKNSWCGTNPDACKGYTYRGIYNGE